MSSLLLIIILLVAINALYVAAEFASVAVRVVRVQALAEEGHPVARKLLPHLKDAHCLDRYVAACQIGITLSSLVLGAFGQGRLAAYLLPHLSQIKAFDPATAASVTATLVLILLTIFQVVLGELLPKAVALRYPERVSLLLTYPMLVSLGLFGWSIKILNGTGNGILKLLKVPTAGHRHVHSPEELERLVSHDTETVTLEETERKLLTRVFRFGDHTAENLMVPRIKVISLDLQAPLEESLARMEASPHTRFPVSDGDVDSVVGYLHLKDVTRALADGVLTDLRSLMRPVTYAPFSLSVDRLFERMRRERAHLVVLLDEFGGTAGIVTMQDVLQEVVGEMQDEFGESRARILEKSGGALLVRGNLLVTQLAEETGLTLADSPASTVGGLVLHLAGGPVSEGDSVEFSGMRLTVVEVKGKRVTRVRVHND